MWRPIDAIADALRHRLGARAQLRAGILTTALSTIWTAWALTASDEPPNVIAMSGVALILTGLGIVVGAQVLEQGETNGNGDQGSDSP